MAEMNKYNDGTFCWPELATTDAAGAKEFYNRIFGWELHDDPVGPDMVYTMARVNGKNVGAMFQQNEQQKKMGMPPNWLSYVSVDDLDEKLDKAKTLGAATVVDAMDVMEVGRMAVLSDPQGAVFALWQPKQHIGAELVNEPVSLSWNELMTTDDNAANEFYKSLFGWSSETMDMGEMMYTSFSNGDRPAGGMMKIDPSWGEIPPHWAVYFAVADCDKTAADITANGGNILAEPKDIPGVGRFAMAQDPQGAAFAIIKLDNPQ